MDLRLRPLTERDEPVARQAQAELAPDDFDFLLEVDPDEPWAAYVARLRQHARGLDLAADRVPATFLVAEVDGEVVGRVSIRHELNDFLRSTGGHIGYGVRPAFRRRGCASEVLRQSLVVARSLGVERALLTCDDGNVGSATVIERHGGVLQDVSATGKRRYWIS